MKPQTLGFLVCLSVLFLYCLRSYIFTSASTSPSSSTLDPGVETLTFSEKIEKEKNLLLLNNKDTKITKQPTPTEADGSLSISLKSSKTITGVKCKQSDAKFISNLTQTRPRIALSSFPRSGLSMVRLLLERATGISTGSFAEESRLLKAGFKGEGFDDSSVSAVKNFLITAIKRDGNKVTALDINKFRLYDKIIYVIRNPFEIFLSYYHAAETNQTIDSKTGALRSRKTKPKVKEVKEEKQEDEKKRERQRKEMEKVRLRKEMEKLLPMWKDHIKFVVRGLDSQSQLHINGDPIKVMLIRFEDLLQPRQLTECFQVEHTYRSMKFCTLYEYELFRLSNFLELPYSFVSVGQSQLPTNIGQSKSKSEPIRVKRKSKNRRTRQDFVRIAPALSEEKIKCAFGDGPKEETVRKNYQHAYEAVPSELRTWFLNETKEELCYLGYIHLFKDLHSKDGISCEGLSISPHLTYSKII